MPLENLAAAPRPQKVPCPPPTRARPADRLAELFLHAWERGRFTRRRTGRRKTGATSR